MSPHVTISDMNCWTVVETSEATFSPTQLHHKETVFTLSNGYVGTRGSFEEGYPGACPATLINGVYDDAPIVATELANCPDWLPLGITVNGEKFRLDRGTVLSYQRSLHLDRGLLSRELRWRSPAGQTVELRFERFVSLADQHVLALRCQITPIDFNGTIQIQAGLNGYSDNQGLLHWNLLDQAGSNDTLWLQVQSRASQIELGMATRLSLTGATPTITASGFQGYPTWTAEYPAEMGQTVAVEKVVTVFTSRETATPVQTALEKLAGLAGYDLLRADHELAWAAVWDINDIEIEGDFAAQLAIRYNLFQLLAATPRHDDRVSIPAKTLSGFAYRGHVFWDTEIFLLPCLTLTQPALACNLLTYRYHMLEGARRKARAAGYEGAMYVWESAGSGDEVTPTWVPHINGKDLVRIWCGEIEVHISTDVAYAIWQYWQATSDDAWMRSYGAEMILDTAVFWGSRVTWNPQHDRYDILNVIGPDEYHEQIDNNTFTNKMAQWHLQTALEVLDWLRQTDSARADQLAVKLDLTPERLHRWREIIRSIYLPQDPTTGLIEQFEGFFALQDIDLNSYEPRSKSMQVILGIEGANQRQVLKQADVLMLLYLLRSAVFADRPTPYYDRQTLQTNWDYYEPRTDHTYGSSLGPPVHAILACELGQPELAYDHFLRSALVDLGDVRGNAHEGIHAASTGGTWQSVVFGFGGIRFTPDGPVAQPQLPPGWTALRFKLVWQGKLYEFNLTAQPTGDSGQKRHQASHAAAIALAHTPVSPRAIQGIIFDLDGVLTDTSEFHYLAWKRLADEAQIPFDRQANEALRGVSRRDSLLFLLQGRDITEEQLQAMMTRKNQYYLELIRTITPDHLLPGVATLLADLRSQGIKIALGSASKNAPEVLQRLGIAAYFDAIADGNSVVNSKPAPDVFLYGAQALGLAPNTCVVVEDAAAGVEAALRAGMWAIGLGPEERVGSAHLVLPNLDHLLWSDLLSQLIAATRVTVADLTLQG